MSIELFDVAIIGGGIGGCAAALQLAQAGQKVVLFEAKSYPHHKVCGEFLSPECAVLLGRLSLLPAIQAFKPAQIHTAAIIAPDGTTWESALPGVGLGISRYTLDNVMAKVARAHGVDFRDQTSITDIHGNLNSAFQLTARSAHEQTLIRAKTVIGAHGKRSSIDRVLNRPFHNQLHSFIALKAHFRGSPPPGRIHLYSFPGGYCGLSEVENGITNVCLLVRQEVFQRETSHAARNIDHFISWMKSQNPALEQWFANAQPLFENWLSIAQVPFADKQVITNDILMVGDSAGLIAPVAGDGMGMALQASHLASTLLIDYLAGNVSGHTLRQQYTSLWWQTFGRRLRLSRALQALMLRPAWLTPGLHLLNALPTLGHFLVKHTRDPHLAARSIS